MGLVHASKEEVAVFLLHSGEATVRGCVAPQLAGAGACAGYTVLDLGNDGLGSEIRLSDPVQLAQERQSGGGLPLEEEDDDREGGLSHVPFKGFVVLGKLPVPQTLFTDEEDEGVGPINL